ncbi:MAG: hypothetical protein KGH71_01245 [Candidatus Micrarchaeota archaeon]|nr:hypothetical protein [Candidatus Micrarchaeota archaeon]
MQVLKQEKLKHIESVLGSSKELFVGLSSYRTNMESVVAGKTKEYNEFVRMEIAPKEGVANVKELVALRDALMQKIGFAPSWRPEIIFNSIGSTFGITQAEIVYTEELPSRYVSASNTAVEGGSRDIWIKIYPNEGMMLMRDVSGVSTMVELMQKSMNFDLKGLQRAASQFKITQRERIKYNFDKLERKQL